MKTKQIFFMALSIAALAGGCKPTDSQPPPDTPPSPQLDQVKKETKEALQVTKEYAYAQKAEFVESMKIELAALEKEIEALALKVQNSSATTNEEAKARLQAIRAKTAELDKQLKEVEGATESSWDAVKAGFKKGYEETKEALNQARQWLSEKIAPSSSP